MDQFAGQVLEGFGVAGGVVILASWAVIGVLWREVGKERDRNGSLQDARLDEAKDSLKVVADSLSTIRAMRGGTP